MLLTLTRISHELTGGILRQRPWWRLALLSIWLLAIVLGVIGQAVAAGPHAAVIELDGIISYVTNWFLMRSR